MSDWQRELNLKDVWDTNDVHLIAKTASERLQALTPFDDVELNEERADIIYDFETLVADSEADADDFDEVMCRLYAWGDTRLEGKWNGKKVCWIATSF